MEEATLPLLSKIAQQEETLKQANERLNELTAGTTKEILRWAAIATLTGMLCMGIGLFFPQAKKLGGMLLAIGLSIAAGLILLGLFGDQIRPVIKPAAAIAALLGLAALAVWLWRKVTAKRRCRHGKARSGSAPASPSASESSSGVEEWEVAKKRARLEWEARKARILAELKGNAVSDVPTGSMGASEDTAPAESE